MILPKTSDKPLEINALNLTDRKVCESLLARPLTKPQLSLIFARIKAQLKHQSDSQSVHVLNELKKQLRAKYSINLSNDIIDHFIATTEKVNSPKAELNFTCIEKEIKSSLQEISRKKYYLNSQNKKETFTRKIISAEKRKRRNIINNTATSTSPHIRSIKNFDEIFIKEKLAIFRDYLEEGEIDRFQEELRAKAEAIDHLSYGKYAQRIKHYTIYDLILQRVFNLVQEDTKNIEIRSKFHNVYKRMKEEMVAIVTNEEDVTNFMRKIKYSSQENLKQNVSKAHPKKNYFQSEREKQDLTVQIEQTLEGAKKHIKDAFIKRGRPDFAYQMQLSLDNRKTPAILKRIRF